MTFQMFGWCANGQSKPVTLARTQTSTRRTGLRPVDLLKIASAIFQTTGRTMAQRDDDVFETTMGRPTDCPGTRIPDSLAMLWLLVLLLLLLRHK
jgi:hypothetical protein